MIGWAMEIKVRAERRAGELLAAMTKKASGGQPYQGKSTGPKKVQVENQPPTLKELKITKNDFATWQQLAKIPLPQFEQRLAKALL